MLTSSKKQDTTSFPVMSIPLQSSPCSFNYLKIPITSSNQIYGLEIYAGESIEVFSGYLLNLKSHYSFSSLS